MNKKKVLPVVLIGSMVGEALISARHFDPDAHQPHSGFASDRIPFGHRARSCVTHTVLPPAFVSQFVSQLAETLHRGCLIKSTA
jgi:hypothetical protein